MELVSRLQGDESKSRVYFYLGIPFLAMLVANFFLPTDPIWDERLFYPVMQAVGANYFPDLEQIRTLNSPMGPVFFIIWGFLGKMVGWSLPVLRGLHIIWSFGFILLLYHTFKDHLRPIVLSLLFFVVNPYFLVMTAPLLYSDVTAMMFLFLGVHYYLNQQNRWLAGIFFGLAICSRQLLIFVPLAVGLADLFWWYKGRVKWQAVVQDFIPLVVFAPLFVLWDFNINSHSFQGNQFEENTLAAFRFSAKTFNYSLLLLGIYAIPFWLTDWKLLFRRSHLVYLIPVALLLLAGLPLKVNAGLQYGDLPETAGLLDIVLVASGFAGYVLMPVGLFVGIICLVKMLRSPTTFESLVCKISLVLFLVLESIYSYCWDKHFLPVMPLIFLLSDAAVRFERSLEHRAA